MIINWCIFEYDHCTHTRCDFDDDLITIIILDVTFHNDITVTILDMTLMMITSLSSYLIWLSWWSHHYHHTLYDYDDDLITIIILDMTMMMISSLSSSFMCLFIMISLSPYSIWLWWWSHHYHHTWYDYHDDLITIIILDMTLMMIPSLSLCHHYIS